MSVERLRGLSPYGVAVRAGIQLSLLQSAILKVIAPKPDPAEALTDAERTVLAVAANVSPRELLRAARIVFRQIFIEAGRQSGKTLIIVSCFIISACLQRIEHLLSAGQRARALVVGPTLNHTRQALDGIAGGLDALSVRAVRRDGEIRILDLRVDVIATVADHLAPRGGTCVAAAVDEASLLPFEEGADGRDVEVLSAIRPSLAVLKGRLLLVSSPWAEQGEHYRLVRKHLGHVDDPEGLALHFPSWAANPLITEAETHHLKPDPRVWAREWAAIPGHNDDAFLDARQIRACIEEGCEGRQPSAGTTYAIAIDAGFRRDQFWIIVGHRELKSSPTGPAREHFIVDYMVRFVPKAHEPVDYAVAMKTVIGLSVRFNHAKIYFDQHCAAAIASDLRQAGALAEEVKSDLAVQARRWERLAQIIQGAAIGLLDGPTGKALASQLTSLRIKMLQGGRIQVSAPDRRGAHDDGPDALSILLTEGLKDAQPGGNSNIELQMPTTRDGNGHWRDGQPQYFETRRLATGEVMTLPIAAPRGSALWHEEREERRSRGVSIPGLDDDEDTLSIPIKH